jgi:hypothetical protein
MLVAASAAPYLSFMRAPFVISLCLIALPAMADTRPVHPAATHAPVGKSANAPKRLDKFDDWQVATHQEGGQTICYGFTRATSSAPAIAARGDVVLTVTQRPASRDAIAISAGFTYAPNTAVSVQVGTASFDFYTSQRSAFSRDGHAATVAFLHGKQAIAKSPGPHGATVTDTFSLRGFEQAYAAINKACPAK